MRLALLAGCGAASALIYLCAFTLPYSLLRGITQPLQHFGTLSGPSWGATLGLILALGALFGLYLSAVRLCREIELGPPGERHRVPFAIVSACGFASALILLWMYPIFSSDVFYYMAADRIWTVFHENPFLVPPLQAAHDVFFPYTRWGHYTLPYGPLWPWITVGPAAMGGGDLVSTLATFKGLAIVGYLLSLPAIAWATNRLHQGRGLTALCLFAWNPLVLIEVAGNGHNEGLALVPVIVAVGLWARRNSAATALSLVVSFLVKATVAIVGPAFMWPSLRRAAQERRLPRWLIGNALPAILISVLAWLPWRFAGLGAPLREMGQYYQSVSALLTNLLPAERSDLGLRVWEVGGLVLIALIYYRQRSALATEGPGALRVIWVLSVIYFLVIMPFYAPWYFLWPVVFGAILAERRITTLNVLLAAGGLASYIVQFVLRRTIPMTPVEVSAVGMAMASLPFLVGWAVLYGPMGRWTTRASRSASPHPALALRAGPPEAEPLPAGRGAGAAPPPSGRGWGEGALD